MELPRIAALDLRPPAVIDPWAAAWDFPSLTSRLATFIDGGPWRPYPVRVQPFTSFVWADLSTVPVSKAFNTEYGYVNYGRLALRNDIRVAWGLEDRSSFERANDWLTKFIKRAFRRPVVMV